MELWERFSGYARRTVLLAHEEAQRAVQEQIGTEHLLSGMLRLGEGMAVDILEGLGVDREELRRELRELIKAAPGQKTTKEVVFTRESQKVLSHAYNEAKNMGQTYLGTEHLLVGLAREMHGKAHRLLKQHGVEVREVRRAALRRAKERFSVRRPRRRDLVGRVVADLGRKAGKEVVVLVVDDGRIESCVSTRSDDESEVLGWVKHLLEAEEKRRDAEAQAEGEEGSEK